MDAAGTASYSAHVAAADGEERRAGRLRRLEALASLLDDRFRVPGTRWRFGFDSIIGLVPGVGDAAGAIISAYIIAEAARLGVPKRSLLKMIANMGVDGVLGVIPLLGDIFDASYKSNRRNVNIALKHLAEGGRERRDPSARND